MAESNWADFFEKCGVHFEYEPHLFELGPNRGFKPDFWFPFTDIYVEVTTTRHIHRKNRKVKMAREAFPGKTFILLTRHEHLLVFGPATDFPLGFQSLDAWTQASDNLGLLLAAIKRSTGLMALAV